MTDANLVIQVSVKTKEHVRLVQEYFLVSVQLVSLVLNVRQILNTVTAVPVTMVDPVLKDLE